MSSGNGVVEIRDLVLNATLQSNGLHPVSTVKKIEGSKQWISFTFQDCVMLQVILKDFAGGKCEVEPQAFYKIICKIKNQIYFMKNNMKPEWVE